MFSGHITISSSLMGQPEHCTPVPENFAKNSHCDPILTGPVKPVSWWRDSLRDDFGLYSCEQSRYGTRTIAVPTLAYQIRRNDLTQQNGNPKPPSKFPQYIAPIIILLLAIGAAIYGVLWCESDDSNSAAAGESTQAEQAEQTDGSEQLKQVESEFPDAERAHQEALATARSQLETYIHSEASLEMQLTAPEYGNEFPQTAANFALDNIEVDWNSEAEQFVMVYLEQYPNTQLNELEELMQHDPQGPQYSPEQTAYALSQLN